MTVKTRALRTRPGTPALRMFTLRKDRVTSTSNHSLSCRGSDVQLFPLMSVMLLINNQNEIKTTQGLQDKNMFDGNDHNGEGK